MHSTSSGMSRTSNNYKNHDNRTEAVTVSSNSVGSNGLSNSNFMYTTRSYTGGLGLYHQQNIRGSLGTGMLGFISGSASIGTGNTNSKTVNGNVNILLGGAMLSLITTILCVVCYCCHHNIKKRTQTAYRNQRQWPETDPNVEIYSVEQSYERSGLFLDDSTDGFATIPTLHHEPPPSYDAVVAMEEQQLLQQQLYYVQAALHNQQLRTSPPPGYRSSADMSNNAEIEVTFSVSNGSSLNAIDIPLFDTNVALTSISSESPMHFPKQLSPTNASLPSLPSEDLHHKNDLRLDLCLTDNDGLFPKHFKTDGMVQKGSKMSNLVACHSMVEEELNRNIASENTHPIQTTNINSNDCLQYPSMSVSAMSLTTICGDELATSSNQMHLGHSFLPCTACSSSHFATKEVEQCSLGDTSYKHGINNTLSPPIENDPCTSILLLPSAKTFSLAEQTKKLKEESTAEKTLIVREENPSRDNEDKKNAKKTIILNSDICLDCPCEVIGVIHTTESACPHSAKPQKRQSENQSKTKTTVVASCDSLENLNQNILQATVDEPIHNRILHQTVLDRQPDNNRVSSPITMNILDIDINANELLSHDAIVETTQLEEHPQQTFALSRRNSTSSAASSNRFGLDIINANGFVRFDMSRIIDHTGLPTYDAALKLDQSGYV